MGTMIFDGVDDRIQWNTLATALADLPTAGYTVATLFKRSTALQWDGMTYLYNAGLTVQYAGFSVDSSNIVVCDTILNGGSPQYTVAVPTAKASIIAVSKGAGTTTPRKGQINIEDATAWVHSAGSGTMDTTVSAAALGVGSFEATDLFGGWLGLVGYWNVAMTDADKELLSTARRTSDWWNHPAGQPKFLMEFNVGTGSLVDIAGNASSIATTGGVGTIDSAELLGGWRFDGKGDEYQIGQSVNPSYADFPKPLLRRSAA